MQAEYCGPGMAGSEVVSQDRVPIVRPVGLYCDYDREIESEDEIGNIKDAAGHRTPKSTQEMRDRCTVRSAKSFGVVQDFDDSAADLTPGGLNYLRCCA